MSDHALRRPALVATQRKQVRGHMIQSTALLRAQLREPLTRQIDRDNMVRLRENRKETAETLRGPTGTMDQQNGRPGAMFLNMPAVGTMQYPPRISCQRPVFGILGPAH